MKGFEGKPIGDYRMRDPEAALTQAKELREKSLALCYRSNVLIAQSRALIERSRELVDRSVRPRLR